MSDTLKELLGPLAPLAGVWEGDKGLDIAPSDDRGIERNPFRERIKFEVMAPIRNHEQVLSGLRYSLVAWERGETDAFHEELGYWLWDPAAKQVKRCFVVPRGITLIAGGTAEPDARTFNLKAEAGSPTYGILSNPFLHLEFQTVRFEMSVTIHTQDSYTYTQDTQLLLKGRKEIFHHRDSNTLQRVE